MNRGKSVVTKPLTEEAVAKIKQHLRDDLKWLSLFTVSVNSAFRSSDLLGLHVSELTDDGDRITILKREKKTRKNRRVVLGAEPSRLLRTWIARSKTKGYVWQGQRGKHTHGFYGAMLKSWCGAIGESTHRVATHSTRKAWARIQHERGAKIEVLMAALGHQSPAQTLTYIHVTPEEVQKLYDSAI